MHRECEDERDARDATTAMRRALCFVNDRITTFLGNLKKMKTDALERSDGDGMVNFQTS